MNKKLKKYFSKKRSIFDNFHEEIIFLHKNHATQKSILEFLCDKDVVATQSNLSKWLSRHSKDEQKGDFSSEKSKKSNIKYDVFKNLKG